MSLLPYIDPYLTAIQYTRYFDWRSARDFSVVNKEARAIYLSDDVQKALISKYFRCAFSTTRPLKDQYLGLAIAHAGRSIPALTGRIQTEGILHCLKVNSYGTKALFYSKEKHAFNLIDISPSNCNKTIYTFPGYKESFGQISMNAKSTRVLSICHDRFQGKLLKYCDAEKGDQFISLPGYKDFKEIQMNDEGTRALSLSRDFELILWDLDESKSVSAFSGISCFKMLPDGKTALLGSIDGTLKRLNIMEGECFDIAYSHKSKITRLQINRDGTRVLSGSSDGILQYWNLPLDGSVSTIPGKFTIFFSLNADGTRALLQEHKESELYLWDLKTNESICCFRRPNNRSLDKEFEHYIRIHSMSGDGSRALMLSGWDLKSKLELWDLIAGKCIYSFPKNDTSFVQMQKSDDELQAIVYRGDSTIEVWDLAPAYPITGNQDHVSATSPKNKDL